MLAVAISMVAGLRQSRPAEPPFPGQIDTVEVEGRVLIMQAVSLAIPTKCLKTDEAQAVESETVVRVRVMIRNVCPASERTLLEKWREELWPRARLDTGIGAVDVAVTLDRPLGRRKVLDEEGREIRVCPITGSRLKTMQQCLTKVRAPHQRSARPG
ncbi:hypothetical protein ABZ815_10085 [Nonomuraea sp. NPDC047529]|uniref:hypothetical protein n=1 Tax=Nonomuraea sp. NPDC047529 TaxID=3155623 RepID=UPI0033E2E160